MQNSQVESFDRTSFSNVFEQISSAYAMEKIPTGGYILVGNGKQEASPHFDVQLTKLDAFCNLVWTKYYGGLNSDYGDDVWPTTDGGFIIAGTTQVIGQGGNNVYVIKTDENGNEEWSNNYGGTDVDIPESILQTEDGGYIFVGRTMSFGAVQFDKYMVRINNIGTIIWSKTSRDPMDDFAWEIIKSHDNNFIILGTESPSNFELNHTLTLEKIDIDSNTIWSKSYGHSVDRAVEHSIILDDDNGFLIASTLGDGFSLVNSDILLIKTDENGDEIWMKTYGGNKNDKAKSVIKTSDNNILILGTTHSYGNGETDIIIVKTDSKGNELWSKTYGGNDSDTAYQIREMEGGNFIICGAIKGNEGLTDFDLIILKINQNGDPI